MLTITRFLKSENAKVLHRIIKTNFPYVSREKNIRQLCRNSNEIQVRRNFVKTKHFA